MKWTRRDLKVGESCIFIKPERQDDELSLHELMEEEKKMPADPKKNIPDSEIKVFSTFGQIGWEFFSQNLLNCKEDDKLKEYINFLSRTKEIKMGLKDQFPDKY